MESEMTPTIFGGNTGKTYADIKRLRGIADKLSSPEQPRDFWSGANALIQAALYRNKTNKADRMQGHLGEQLGYDHPVMRALLGLPKYRLGTDFHPGGRAIVGEDGPEVVYLPRGSAVQPNPQTLAWDQRDDGLPPVPNGVPADMAREFLDLPEEDRKKILQQLLDGVPQNEAFQPEGYEQRFIPGAEYKTADMSGIGPSGVGEQSQLNALARSYQGLMKSLDDYEKMFADGGSTMRPGTRKDALSTAHRDLQMQMKELYNLGVLNGPDLELMNSILINPTSAGGNIMDALGIADMEERIPANIAEVRRMMTNRTQPALQQLGIDPQSLMPKSDPGQLSDEELLKMLGGGG